MTTETMTIHRALAELKVLDDRITKLLSERCPSPMRLLMLLYVGMIILLRSLFG